MAKLEEEKGIKSKRLGAQPKLFEDTIPLWHAFLFLTQRRQHGMEGYQPLSASDIKAYADMKGIVNYDDLEVYMLMMSHLDKIWMEEYEERKSKETAKGKPSNLVRRPAPGRK